MNHTADCMCPTCLMLDLDQHVAAKGGKVYLNEAAPEPVKTRNKTAGQRSGRGYVRTISVPQQNLIKRLINEKDTSGIVLLPGQTLNIAEIPTMGVKGGTALIEKLFNCPNKPNQTVRMATEGQKGFIRSLNNNSGNTLTEADITSISFVEVNDVIALLKKLVEAHKEETAKKIAKKEITEGAYWYGELIARVQRTKDGKRMYAKLQAEKGSKLFNYEPGLMGKLKEEDKLSLNDMREFAQAHSACADCGTRMTHPMSIARGVGPVCSGKGYTEI